MLGERDEDDRGSLERGPDVGHILGFLDLDRRFSDEFDSPKAKPWVGNEPSFLTE
jgi:hypothetical protein